MKNCEKRHILLLEVMIAIALVVLCVIPLLSPHLFVLKYQREFIDKIELDHTVNLLYADFVMRLYKNEISFDQIQSKQAYPIDRTMLERIGKGEIPFKGTYRFKKIKNKPDPPEEFTVYLFSLEFVFKNRQEHKFPYEITIVRDLSSEGQGA